MSAKINKINNNLMTFMKKIDTLIFDFGSKIF